MEKFYKDHGFWESHRYAIQGLMIMAYFTKSVWHNSNSEEKLTNYELAEKLLTLSQFEFDNDDKENFKYLSFY